MEYTNINGESTLGVFVPVGCSSWVHLTNDERIAVINALVFERENPFNSDIEPHLAIAYDEISEINSDILRDLKLREENNAINVQTVKDLMKVVKEQEKNNDRD